MDAAEPDPPVIIRQPLLVRRYAGAVGILAKTDKIDAAILASYGAIQPEVRPLATGNIREIRDLIARRRQFIVMSTMEKNRLDVMPKVLKADIRRHVRHLQAQTEKIERIVAELVDSIEDASSMPWRLTRPGGVKNMLNGLTWDHSRLLGDILRFLSIGRNLFRMGFHILRLNVENQRESNVKT